MSQLSSKSEASIMLLCQQCSTLQIKNCLKSTSAIKVATMKNTNYFHYTTKAIMCYQTLITAKGFLKFHNNFMKAFQFNLKTFFLGLTNATPLPPGKLRLVLEVMLFCGTRLLLSSPYYESLGWFMIYQVVALG